MLKLILKIALAVIIACCAVMLFIHVLPWILGLITAVALARLCHHWACRCGFEPPAWWPWRKEANGSQPAA